MPKKIGIRRFGKGYEVKISKAEDLTAILELEASSWTATNVTAKMIHCDPVFLEYLDIDKNGRILCFEVKQAVRWLTTALQDLSEMMVGSDVLTPEAVNRESDVGRMILEGAEFVSAAEKGVPEAAVTLSEVRRKKHLMETTSINAQGIVLPSAVRDKETAEFIKDVISTMGGVLHPSGREGIDESRIQAFFHQAEAYLQWEAESPLKPLGDATEAASAVFLELSDRMDEFYLLCQKVSLERHLPDRSFPVTDEGADGNRTFNENLTAFLETSPISEPKEEPTLHFAGYINPFYREKLSELKSSVIDQLLEEEVSELTAENWERIKEKMTPYCEWISRMPAETDGSGDGIPELGSEKLRLYTDKKYLRASNILIEKTKKVRQHFEKILLVEKTILYQVWLLKLVNNFVNFSDFFDLERRALFEEGTLIIDGRKLNLALLVENRTAHAFIAANSNMFVIYAEVQPPNGEKFEIAAPVTAGTKGNLFIGKLGIFRDIDGGEFHAVITQVIDNPISLKEAFFAPWKRLRRFVTEKVEGLTTTREKELEKMIKQPGMGGTQPASGGSTSGAFMGIGVAVAALGSAGAFIVKTLSGLRWYTVAGTLGAAILAIMIPGLLLSAIKLNKRDLSSILEASGWAINVRMKLTGRLARHFTQYPSYPVVLKRFFHKRQKR